MKEKKDCFAYRKNETDVSYCACLKKLYCKIEECKFYKKKGEIKKCN